MTRREFIDKLKAALEQDLSPGEVQEQVTFYNDYIRDEVRKGRTEEAVTAELGDPWAIARNIISAAEITGEGSFGQESGGRYQEPERRRSGAYRKRAEARSISSERPAGGRSCWCAGCDRCDRAGDRRDRRDLFPLSSNPGAITRDTYYISDIGKTPVKTGVFC